jgi:hypothetical protein
MRLRAKKLKNIFKKSKTTQPRMNTDKHRFREGNEGADASAEGGKEANR